MRKAGIYIIGAVCALAWLPAGAQEAQLPEDAKAGREIAERICSRCHAIGPEAESPHKDAPPFRQIVAKGNVQNLEEALGEGIVVGHPDMPQFQFSPRDVGALVAYLKSLSGKS
jgi:mono/diheme cytochrome c family protein